MTRPGSDRVESGVAVAEPGGSRHPASMADGTEAGPGELFWQIVEVLHVPRSLAERELARSRSDVANGVIRPGDPAEPYALAWRRIRTQWAGQELA
ncbi:hypothetical protein GCM10017786_16040 [Amycolatopsis deserti]|uniref:Uncharacterized protein n=3 Tax=Amycolatopsis TaxID=1813 RepID=A0ABQ3IHU5_9PSEU|nr:hypothetical protein GCM10017786_16040 [Amycolatopsis deserti]